MARFTGKSVVVTGAAQGMGLALVQRFLDEGANVVAFDNNADRLLSATGDLGERCVPFVVTSLFTTTAAGRSSSASPSSAASTSCVHTPGSPIPSPCWT